MNNRIFLFALPLVACLSANNHATDYKLGYSAGFYSIDVENEALGADSETGSHIGAFGAASSDRHVARLEYTKFGGTAELFNTNSFDYDSRKLTYGYRVIKQRRFALTPSIGLNNWNFELDGPFPYADSGTDLIFELGLEFGLNAGIDKGFGADLSWSYSDTDFAQDSSFIFRFGYTFK